MGLTSIQWCQYTFNPWMGCNKVPGVKECAHCYIDRTPPFRIRKFKHGMPRIRTSDSTWKNPVAWNNQQEEALNEFYMHQDLHGGFAHYPEPERPRVFCLSLGDWLDDQVPIEWLSDLLDLIAETPNLNWLLLTKRPQNFTRRISAIFHDVPEKSEAGSDMVINWDLGHAPANVWIGVSAGADQAAALEIPAKVHFLSCEPMLHPLDTTHAAKFDWIIFGGESGTNARECHVQWIREGVSFCRDNGVAPFVKQLGALPIIPSVFPLKQPCKLCLKDSHGGDMTEWPADLRVREFPKVRAL